MSGLVAWKGVIRRRLVTRRKILSYRAKVNLQTKRMKASFCHIRWTEGEHLWAPGHYLLDSFSAQCLLAPLAKTRNFPAHPGITSGEDDGGKDGGQAEEKAVLSG